MGMHLKRKPQRPVPGTRKPTASWPIQPKDIPVLVARQKQGQTKLTDEAILWQKEELLRQLRKFTHGFEEQIRIVEAEIEQQRLKMEQGRLKLQRGPH